MLKDRSDHIRTVLGAIFDDRQCGRFHAQQAGDGRYASGSNHSVAFSNPLVTCKFHGIR
jgi:hypothetical protein